MIDLNLVERLVYGIWLLRFIICTYLWYTSGLKAVDILEAYEGTLEDDYPPDNERTEHGEMLLYKVTELIDLGP